MELAKLEEVMNEASQLSPKAKGIKNSTVRRKKRPLPHMRSQHLDEALSPVTTPTDEDVIQRIKQVAGSTQTRSPDHHHMLGGLALYSVSKLLLIISFVYDKHTQICFYVCLSTLTIIIALPDFSFVPSRFPHTKSLKCNFSLLFFHCHS